jgi:hypothetical protein
MTARDFDQMLAEKAGDRPTFTVGGQTFSLRAKLPYKRWNKLLASMRADGADPQEQTAEFFRTVLIRADRERFVELLDKEDDEDDEEAVIDLSQMDAITDWIMEHFTGKLRNSSDSSSPGANGTGQPLNVVSLQSRNTGA